MKNETAKRMFNNLDARKIPRMLTRDLFAVANLLVYILVFWH